MRNSSAMLQRLYVHNFRCLENFELILKDTPTALLIGKNGTGKSTVATVLEIFQSIGRGANRVGSIVRESDFTGGRKRVPIRFEVEVILNGILYTYVLALELPESFKELRVFEERLTVAGEPIYSRDRAQVTIHTGPEIVKAEFSVDWHLVALPIIQEPPNKDRVSPFRTWLASSVILAPIPPSMTGDSIGVTLEPNKDGSNIGEWISSLLVSFPAVYEHVAKYLRGVMPDFKDFQNPAVGIDARSLIVRFEENPQQLAVPFKKLSDGEKCFFLCAVVLAAYRSYGPLFCFWDEPDNYLALTEVGFFVTELRRSFTNSGQILVTSHNREAIRKFSNDSTFLLHRRSHMEPTQVRPLSGIPISQDPVEALESQDVEP
jgi:predicted ATPase